LNKLGIGERAPWGKFPKIVRNGNLGELAKEPEYKAAKSGDWTAALDLVDRLLTDDTISQIKTLIGEDKPRLLPILAVEDAGNNKIPLAMAEVLAERLGLEVELGIVQREKVGRTGAGSDHRLAFNPTFEGDVYPSQKYLILDDTLTMGGTVASLRGYVENNGGTVVGASVMVAHEGALELPIKPSMLAAIEKKHGPAINDYWKETFGYGIERLTQGEAGHLKAAVSVESIRDRISEARHAGIERIDASRDQAAQRARPQIGEVVSDAEQDDASLVETNAVEQEQHAMLESAPVEQTYQEALVLHVQAKHTQVERIEDRLESLIGKHQAQLQQLQANAPRLLSLPSTKRSWQVQQSQQQARLHTLHNRLESVREIKDGMGVHSPKIEELATRKMRAENPELAADWDSMREASRRHLLLSRQQESERARKQEQGRSQSLGLTSRPIP
jgi:adenine/guanine phosphoribosyltransferase-like PRPP-binding protein